jgi:hypothetical protein
VNKANGTMVNNSKLPKKLLKVIHRRTKPKTKEYNKVPNQ